MTKIPYDSQPSGSSKKASSSRDAASRPENAPGSADPAMSSTQMVVLAARFENLDRVRDFVGDQAEKYGLEPAAVYAVQLAVDEAFSNIIEHAYGGESDENVECATHTTRNELIITLRDCGRPFNPESVPAPDLEADLEEREIGGLGLYFIRQLMDEVEFTFVHDTEQNKACNLLRMVKRKEQ
jgi:anti-sigma regulatory factor (Ser/Thr protein kinase)